jgi:hypothetical protein
MIHIVVGATILGEEFVIIMKIGEIFFNPIWYFAK